MIESISRGTQIIIDGIALEVERTRMSGREFLLFDPINDREISLSFADFSSKLMSGALTFADSSTEGEIADLARLPESLAPLMKTATDISSSQIDPSSQAKIEYRIGYINAVADDQYRLIKGTGAQRYRLAKHAAETGDDSPPSLSSVHRWINRLRANRGNLLCLLRKKRAPSKTPPKTDREIEMERKNDELFNHVVQNHYLKKKKFSIVDVHEEMRAAVMFDAAFSDCSVPSLSTVYRKIGRIPAYKKVRTKKGYKEAKRSYPTGYRVEEPTNLLEWVELDHTQLDIMAFDHETGEAIGRPWITIFIDKKSRMVLGFYIAMHAPTVRSVLSAFRNAISDKSYVKDVYGDFIENEWPCMGIMDQVITDNGSDLTAEETKRILSGFTDVVYNPPGEPQLKGVIERFNRTINEGIFHMLSGTTFASYQKKGEYNSVKEAALSLEEIVKLTHKWIIDVYHVKTHRTLNMSPLQCWKANLHTVHAVRMPKDIKVIDQLMWKPDTRTIQKNGVSINNLSYQSPQLMEIAKQYGIGKKVDILVDEYDLRVIRVVIPETDRAIDVPCRQWRYVEDGLTLRTHKILWKTVLQNKKARDAVSDPQLLRAKRELQLLEEKARKSANKARRSAAARRKQALANSVESTGTTPPSIGEATHASGPSSDLENMEFELLDTMEVNRNA